MLRKSLYGPCPKDLKRCYTVGELVELLASLPAALPINDDDGVIPFWYKVGIDQPGANGEHLRLEEENDGWEDDHQ